jgi:hypothetical protein
LHKVASMTSTVARRVKACFTTRMKQTAPAKTKRETIYAKAERLMAEGGRVKTIAAHEGEYWLGTIKGDHGTYRACAVSPAYAEQLGIDSGRISCRCRAGRQGKLCSHAIIAEEMRKQGERA